MTEELQRNAVELESQTHAAIEAASSRADARVRDAEARWEAATLECTKLRTDNDALRERLAQVCACVWVCARV